MPPLDTRLSGVCMPKCSYCGVTEEKDSPLCQSCGALRYPVATNIKEGIVNRHKKLKISASVVAAILTPGSLVLLAVLGAHRINSKIKHWKAK